MKTSRHRNLLRSGTASKDKQRALPVKIKYFFLIGWLVSPRHGRLKVYFAFFRNIFVSLNEMFHQALSPWVDSWSSSGPQVISFNAFRHLCTLLQSTVLTYPHTLESAHFRMLICPWQEPSYTETLCNSLWPDLLLIVWWVFLHFPPQQPIAEQVSWYLTASMDQKGRARPFEEYICAWLKNILY